VVLIATLHDLHEKVPGYGFGALSKLLKKVSPQRILVELQQSDLDGDLDQLPQTKAEYPNAIIPFSKENHVSLHALEPSGPKRDKILSNHRKAWIASEAHPMRPAFNTYVDLLFHQLLQCWTSPMQVHSTHTVESLRLKHSYQEEMFSVDSPSWDEWNQHFLSVIEEVARKFPGDTLAVTVGAEHIYWLQDKLAKHENIELVPVASFF
jgi:hypothetical protein